jgi:cytochrome c oxidase subunit 3
VSLHLRYGMIMFIASEVMFFVAWFWAVFDASLFYDQAKHSGAARYTGGTWPPAGVEVLDPLHLPLYNTVILLLSGTTVTWAHHALLHGDRSGLKWGLALTIVLGILFTSVQAYEYAHAPYSFSGSLYGATFFMATGFHGFHVLVGTIFLLVCLFRAMEGATSRRSSISASRRRPGTGTSSTWSGCSCSSSSMSGAPGAPPSRTSDPHRQRIARGGQDGRPSLLGRGK